MKERKDLYIEAIKSSQIKKGHIVVEEPFYTFNQKNDGFVTSLEKRSSEEKMTEGPHLVIASNTEGVNPGDYIMLHATRPAAQIFLNPNKKSGYRLLLVHEENYSLKWTNEQFKKEFFHDV